MTDNNIIELTPFRADLTRALSRRGEQLLAATDRAADVANLEPLEAYYIVREIGLDRALPVLLQLSHEQLEACIDLDCWNRYDFAADRLDEWLTAFALAGPEALAKAFFSLDYVVQLIHLAQTVTVYDPDTDQVPGEDEENGPARAMTPDGFYLLELKTELALKMHPFTLVDALYQYDLAATLGLQKEVLQALREPRFHSWYDLSATEQSDEPGDRLEHAFVTALCCHHPLRGGFDLANAESVEAFACLADINGARIRLKRLVARICRRS